MQIYTFYFIFFYFFDYYAGNILNKKSLSKLSSLTSVSDPTESSLSIKFIFPVFYIISSSIYLIFMIFYFPLSLLIGDELDFFISSESNGPKSSYKIL